MGGKGGEGREKGGGREGGRGERRWEDTNMC